MTSLILLDSLSFVPPAQRYSQRAELPTHKWLGTRRPPSGLSDLPSRRYFLLKRDSKEHILIGDNGQACIANTGHTSVASIGFATFRSGVASGTMSLDEFRWRWAAPELQRPDEYDMSKVVATKASDIYGIGMVIYEASPHASFVLLQSLIFVKVLAREVPFSEYADLMVLTEIQNGKRPRRPAGVASLGITESIWMLLEQCWDWEPRYRPDSAHVLSVIREVQQSGDARVAASTQFKLKMKDVVINLTAKRNINPYITLQYGSRVHTTSRATAVGGNKYTWYRTPVVSASSLFHKRLQG